jgi:pimeloyl-ACP methyl ester carboxylesterase
VHLAAEESGEGIPVVLLHGLTATRRYVVMGSSSLQRSGHRVVAYDARGHGESDPGPDGYGYEQLGADLVRVLDERGLDRAVLAGASMGAHTVLRLALEQPERVAGLVVVTPSYTEEDFEDPASLTRWDALSKGLREGGVEGFVEAYGEPAGDPKFRDTVLRVIRQRLALHEHRDALADALEQVPRSRPFPSVDDLGQIDVPAVVVASGDGADPGHPFAVGERYAETLPQGRLVTEDEGESPVAWQGARLSRVIAELADSAMPAE